MSSRGAILEGKDLAASSLAGKEVSSKTTCLDK
jgi:hypothetical protein